VFKAMMNDRIAVVKRDGQRYDNLRGVVERTSIIFDDVHIPLDEGDHIERQLPGGRTELYEVLESGFTSGGGGIPDFYNAKVRKTTSRLPVPGSPTHVTVTGPNARVNLGSIDSSTNIVSQPAVSDHVFRALIETLNNSVAAPAELERLTDQVAAMKASVGSSAYNRAYADFIQLAANWMTIVAPFIPALTHGLSQ